MKSEIEKILKENKEIKNALVNNGKKINNAMPVKYNELITNVLTKLNNKILKDEKFKNEIKQNVEKLKEYMIKSSKKEFNQKELIKITKTIEVEEIESYFNLKGFKELEIESLLKENEFIEQNGEKTYIVNISNKKNSFKLMSHSGYKMGKIYLTNKFF